jgi:hypothetical protein
MLFGVSDFAAHKTMGNVRARSILHSADGILELDALVRGVASA